MSLDVAGLVPYGWNARVEALLVDRLDGLVPARVVRVTRTTCRVVTPTGEVVAVATTLPAVGDWVGIDDADPPVVTTVAEQWSALTRMDPHGDRLQVLAANVDLVLVTCPADRPSIERVERETVLAWDAGAQPAVLVTKADLDAAELVAALRDRLVGVDVLQTSAHDRAGVAEVAALLAPDRTAVVLGPSGAGKSTLINALLGEDRLATGAVRDEDARGRHTTTTRDLVAIPSGGVVIDTPGLRSLGLGTDRDVGMANAFADIAALAEGCRFRDCVHESEPGCAVRAAVVAGTLDPDRFASYRKLAEELVYEEQRVDPAAARAQREQWKAASKAYRRDRPKP
jgi:ribosome biogenesis GTPase / thiamine phosphate phosphatase